MAFRSNEELKRFSIGKHIQLNEPVPVPAGEFTKGSILRIIGKPNDQGKFQCVDLDSNETVMLHPELNSFSSCENPSNNIERQIPDNRDFLQHTQINLNGGTHRIGSIFIYQQHVTPFGLLPKKTIEENLSTDQLTILRHHSKAFACLDSNAFGPITEDEYIPEAYANLWSNSALGDIPNLYPATAYELTLFQCNPRYRNYSLLPDDRRAEIEEHLLKAKQN